MTTLLYPTTKWLIQTVQMTRHPPVQKKRFKRSLKGHSKWYRQRNDPSPFRSMEWRWRSSPNEVGGNLQKRRNARLGVFVVGNRFHHLGEGGISRLQKWGGVPPGFTVGRMILGFDLMGVTQERDLIKRDVASLSSIYINIIYTRIQVPFLKALASSTNSLKQGLWRNSIHPMLILSMITDAMKMKRPVCLWNGCYSSFHFHFREIVAYRSNRRWPSRYHRNHSLRTENQNSQIVSVSDSLVAFHLCVEIPLCMNGCLTASTVGIHDFYDHQGDSHIDYLLP